MADLPIDINKNKKSKKKDGDGSDRKMPRPIAYRIIARSIDRAPGGMRDFPERFHAVRMDEGRRIIIRELADGLVVVSNRDEIALNILQFTLGLVDDFAMDWRSAQAAADFWLNVTEVRDMPPHFQWKDEEGLTFQRLPWYEGTSHATATWDALLSRMSNAQAFRVWVGSLFSSLASHQQYVWIYGEGGEGKGCIDRFLQQVFGYGYRSEEPPAPGDKFWTYFLIGARLVAFADCNAKGFPASGRFKSMCANDAVRCEEKGGSAFSARLGCRFIFYSNERPQLSTEKADMRRVIYCEFEPQENAHDPRFEENLWLEGGAFLTSCIKAYEQEYPSHGPLKAEMQEIQDWAASNESHLEEIFSENFAMDPGSYVTANKMASILRVWVKDKGTREAFQAYIARVYKLKSKPVKENGKVERRYVGVRFTPKYVG